MPESFESRQRRWRSQYARRRPTSRADKTPEGKLEKLQTEAAEVNAPQVEPTRPIAADIFGRAQEAATSAGQAIRMGWRGLWNTPFVFSSIAESLRETGELPKLSQIAAELYSDPDGLMFKGKVLGKDVEIRTPKPQRIRFDDELKLLGVPELGRPSDLPIVGLAYTEEGKGLPLRKEGLLDPTVRGVAGFVGEAATSPISYARIAKPLEVGIARTGAGKAVARVLVSKKGERAFRKIYNDVIERRLGKPAAEAIGKMTTQDLEAARDEAATKLWTMAAKAPDLLDRPAVALAGYRLPGSRTVLGGMTKLRGRAAARLEKWAPYRSATHLAGHVERMFSVVTRKSRRFAGAEESISQFHADRRNRANAIRQQVESWMKGLKNDKAPDGTPLADYVRGALDNPDKYPVEKLPQAVREMVEEMRPWHDTMHTLETSLGYTVPRRENYLKHIYYVAIGGKKARPITADEWNELGGEQAIRYLGSTISKNVGGAANARTFVTYDDAIPALNRQAAERGLNWTFSPAPLEESLLTRGLDHAEAVSAGLMEGRFLRDHGVDPTLAARQHFKTVLPELQELVDNGTTRLEGAYKIAGEKLKAIMDRYAARSVKGVERRAAKAASAQAERFGRKVLTSEQRKQRIADRIGRQLERTRARIAKLETAQAAAPEPRQIPGPRAVRREQRIKSLQQVERKLNRRLQRASGRQWSQTKARLETVQQQIANLEAKKAEPITVTAKSSVARSTRLRSLKQEEIRLTRRLATHLSKPATAFKELKPPINVEEATRRAAMRGVSAAMRSVGGKKLIRRQDQLAKAFYWFTRLKQVSSLDDYEALVKEHPDVLGIDNELIRAMQEYMGSTYRTWTNTFRDEFAEALVTYKGQSRSYFLPKPLAEDLTRLLETRPLPPELRGALHYYDTATSLWKAGVTTWVPSFFTRNGYNNIVTNFVDVGVSAIDPTRGRRSMLLLNGGEFTIKTPTGNLTASQFRDAMRYYGVFNDADFALEVGGTARRTKILAHGPVRWGQKINAYIENWAKMNLALAHTERGMGLREAAWRTQQVLFDYEYLTAMEKQWFRRAMPFYTWYRKNMALYARLMVEEPGRISMLERFNATNDHERGPENGALSLYLSGAYKLRSAKKGKATYWYGIDLPHRAFLDNFYVGDRGFSQTLRRFGGTINPILKAIEAFQFEQDPMTGADLKLPRRITEGYAAVIKALPQQTQDMLEFREVQRYGETTWQINGTKAYAIFNALAINRFLWPLAAYGEAKEKDYEIDNVLLDVALGINTETFDLSELEQRRIRKEIRATEERLIRAGVRRPYQLVIPVPQE